MKVLPVWLSITVLASVSLLSACGSSATSSASTLTSATSASTSASTSTSISISISTTISTTSASASTSAVVPELLDFTAPLVGGGEFNGAQAFGRPTAFWFWAPT